MLYYKFSLLTGGSMKTKLLILVLLAVYGCGPSQPEATKKDLSEQQKPAEDPYMRAGIAFLQQGDVPEAIRNFDESIKHDPTDPQRYLVLGHTYMRLQNYHRAIDTYNAALRYSQNNGEIYYLLAICYAMIGDETMTKESIEKSIVLFTQARDEENLAKALAFVRSLNGAPQEGAEPNSEAVTE
jgi:tetratricopeptide (TPR) repeat protein